MDIPSPHTPGDDERSGSTTALNAAERVWAAQHRELVAELCDGDVDAWTVGHLFDRVHGTWQASTQRSDPQPLVHAFGVALGDLVVREVPELTWVSFRDDEGGELALSALGDPLVVFPLASVAEHWGTVEPGWFTAHVQAVADQASRLLTAPMSHPGPGAASSS